MTGGPQTITDLRAWLDDTVPLDPLLNEPLELYGSRARRRIQAEALLRQLGFDHRLDRYGWEAHPVADSTVALVFGMLDRLADLRDRGRAHLPTVARDVVLCETGWDRPRGPDGIVALRALLDLGFGHLHLHGGEIRDVLAAASGLYVEEMAGRVLTMLRRWQRHGWIHDTTG